MASSARVSWPCARAPSHSWRKSTTGTPRCGVFTQASNASPTPCPACPVHWLGSLGYPCPKSHYWPYASTRGKILWGTAPTCGFLAPLFLPRMAAPQLRVWTRMAWTLLFTVSGSRVLGSCSAVAFFALDHLHISS